MNLSEIELPSIRRHQVKQLLLHARNTTDTYASICTRNIPEQRPGRRHAAAGHSKIHMDREFLAEGVAVKDCLFSIYFRSLFCTRRSVIYIPSLDASASHHAYICIFHIHPGFPGHRLLP